MSKWSPFLKELKFCRWCSKTYTAKIPFKRDGFCSPLCRQAHYRAYKKYVIRASSPTAAGPEIRGTSK